jgi:hypothetical protein
MADIQNQIATFAPLDQGDLIISTENITSTVWENNSPTLSTFFTSSTQVASTTGQFYYNVYADITLAGSNQFAIAYCDSKGSGSVLYNPNVDGLSPTRTNYGQYRSLILGDEDNAFVFGNQEAEYFYSLPIERSGYKEKLLPGVMSLCLSGSAGELHLTDDSKLGGAATFSEAGRVYNIVSGSAGTVNTSVNENGWSANSGSYGWFLPDIGAILLNGHAVDEDLTLGTLRNSNTEDNNPGLIYNALNLGGTAPLDAGWTLNSSEQLSSDFIFVRAKSQNFNYSTNPSFISGSDGSVIHDSFINDPQVYITTVGLYNNNQELVAVAKLSRPLLKDFTKELLMRIKLDF